MGLILDSSVVIAAERRGDNVTQMLRQIVAATGDQRTVLSSVGLTELVHGIYRAQKAEARSRRDSFIRELLNDVEVLGPKTPNFVAVFSWFSGVRTIESS